MSLQTDLFKVIGVSEPQRRPNPPRAYMMGGLDCLHGRKTVIIHPCLKREYDAGYAREARDMKDHADALRRS